MKKWNVSLVKVYHKNTEMEIKAESEQEAIQLAEEIGSDEDVWSDYELVEQYVDEVEKI